MLTPGMEMEGGKTLGANICATTPSNRIEYNTILLFIYVIYIIVYQIFFIYIMNELQKSSTTCLLYLFCLVADLLNDVRDGDGQGGPFGTILRQF